MRKRGLPPFSPNVPLSGNTADCPSRHDPSTPERSVVRLRVGSSFGGCRHPSARFGGDKRAAMRSGSEWATQDNTRSRHTCGNHGRLAGCAPRFRTGRPWRGSRVRFYCAQRGRAGDRLAAAVRFFMIRDAVDMIGDRFGVTRFTIDNHSTYCPTSRRADSRLHDSWSLFRPRENVLIGQFPVRRTAAGRWHRTGRRSGGVHCERVRSHRASRYVSRDQEDGQGYGFLGRGPLLLRASGSLLLLGNAFHNALAMENAPC